MTPLRWLRDELDSLVSDGLIAFVAALLFMCVLHGCATMGTPLPMGVRNGAEQAVHIVWAETYGRLDRPPLVRWVQGKALSCTDPASGRPGFLQAELGDDLTEPARAVCHEGFTWSPTEVLVAYHDERSFSETALAHELMHALMLRQFQVDPHHRGPEWKALEECVEGAPPLCGIVDLANRKLIEAGR